MIEAAEPLGRPKAGAADEIRAALARVLASDCFRGSPRLSSFLSFIVERTIEGRACEIKGYTIAVEALGRDQGFDPQADPIVRVEAGRLRKALAQFYAGEGAGESVRIAIPVGGYVPVFRSDTEAVEPERDPVPRKAAAALRAAGWSVTTQPLPQRSQWRRWFTAAAFFTGAALASLALIFASPRELQGRTVGAAPQAASVLAPAEASPVAAQLVARLPIVAVTIVASPGDPVQAEASRKFARFLVDGLARFDDLVTIKTNARVPPTVEDADYSFELSLGHGDDADTVLARLQSLKDGRIVWTTGSAHVLSSGLSERELADMAQKLASHVAEPFGVIQADARYHSPSPAMRCIFLAQDLRRSMKAGEHLAARKCLEAVLEADPNFHPAWSHLSALTLMEHTSGLNPKAGAPLDRALGEAMNALRIAPSSARARKAKMDVLFARGQFADALRDGHEALARNPYDPEIMADVGSRYIQLNRPAEGLPLLQRAIDLSSGRPPRYDFFAFLGAHLLGSAELSQTYLAVLLIDKSPLGLLARAMRSALHGDASGLETAVSTLAAQEPLFRVDPALYLERKGFQPPVRDRILADLGPAALQLLKAY